VTVNPNDCFDCRGITVARFEKLPLFGCEHSGYVIIMTVDTQDYQDCLYSACESDKKFVDICMPKVENYTLTHLLATGHSALRKHVNHTLHKKSLEVVKLPERPVRCVRIQFPEEVRLNTLCYRDVHDNRAGYLQAKLLPMVAPEKLGNCYAHKHMCHVAWQVAIASDSRVESDQPKEQREVESYPTTQEAIQSK
jgi:hypothetical protein